MIKIFPLALLFIIFPKTSFVSQGDNLYKNWINDFNNSPISNLVSQYYTTNAYVDYSNGIEGGIENITAQVSTLKKITGEINYITILGQTQGKNGNLMIIGKMLSQNGDFAILTSYKKTVNGMLKEYEIIRPLESEIIVEDPVLSQREAWQKYSNTHKPSILIDEVYATPSYYLNQGNLLQEKSEINEEYSYMKNKAWSITLSKEYLLKVNDHLIFEIGTYKSNGFGQYLLIWERSSNGKWKILLDSNF